ncbi:MAG: HAD family hydrolase [candidate division Zixibacteria bacterium]|nr:HAD family hydrolase [candidate division Zixibacteria bacterium]
MEKLRPRAVIFDLGSTLIEYEAVPWHEMNRQCVASAHKFLLKKGYQLSDETSFYDAFQNIRCRYREAAAETLVEWTVPQVATELFERLGLEMDDGIIDRFFDAYYKPVEKILYAYDDVLDTLGQVKNKIPVLGLISNTVFPARAHLKELEEFNIKPFLNFTVFSSSFKLRKPHPDIFYRAANLAGFAPSECVYVGDRYVEDVEGPTGVGMTPILKIIEGRDYPEDMPDTLRTIRTLAELERHIEI